MNKNQRIIQPVLAQRMYPQVMGMGTGIIQPVLPPELPQIKYYNDIALKIMSFNVCDEGNLYYMVKGKDNYKNFLINNSKFIGERRIEIKNVIIQAIKIHNPDIICLQESFIELREILDKAILNLDGYEYEKLEKEYTIDDINFKDEYIKISEEEKQDYINKLNQSFSCQNYIVDSAISKVTSILHGYVNKNISIEKNYTLQYNINYYYHNRLIQSRIQIFGLKKNNIPFIIVNIHGIGVPIPEVRIKFFDLLKDFLIQFNDIPIIMVGDYNIDFNIETQDSNEVKSLFMNSLQNSKENKQTSFKKIIQKKDEWMELENPRNNLDYLFLLNFKEGSNQYIKIVIPENFNIIESPISHSKVGTDDIYSPNFKSETSGFPSDHALIIHEISFNILKRKEELVLPDIKVSFDKFQKGEYRYILQVYTTLYNIIKPKIGGFKINKKINNFIKRIKNKNNLNKTKRKRIKNKNNLKKTNRKRIKNKNNLNKTKHKRIKNKNNLNKTKRKRMKNKVKSMSKKNN